MRKIIIVLFAVLTTYVNGFSISPKIDGDDIPIPLICNESEADTIIFRAPVIPISATLIPSQSIISVTFWNNMGDVTIELSNLLTGEEYIYEESSSSGSAILPFTGSAGYYYIRFRTIAGVSYFGYFSLE